MNIRLNLTTSKVCNYFPSQVCSRCSSLGNVPEMIQNGHQVRTVSIKLTPLQSCWGLATQIFLECPLHDQLSFIIEPSDFIHGTADANFPANYSS